MLDVTDPEPLPADHPMWRHPKIRIFPHRATAASEGVDDTIDVCLDNRCGGGGGGLGAVWWQWMGGSSGAVPAESAAGEDELRCCCCCCTLQAAGCQPSPRCPPSPACPRCRMRMLTGQPIDPVMELDWSEVPEGPPITRPVLLPHWIANK